MAVTSQNASEKMRETLPPTSGDFGTLHYPESSFLLLLLLLLSSSTFTPSVFHKIFLFICLILFLSPCFLPSLTSSIYFLPPCATGSGSRPPLSPCLLPSSLPPYLQPRLLFLPPLSGPSLPASAPLSLPVSSVTIPPPLQDPFYLHITSPPTPTPTQPAQRRSSVKY